MGKKWYHSKTIWVNLAALVTGIGAWVSGELSWQVAVWPAVLGLMNLGLRMITQEPIE